MSYALARRSPAQLSEEHTTFVGRRAELACLRELFVAARLVTITGPGGVGKSRLALRAAALAESGFGDGVRIVELSALRDPGLLASTVAAALGLDEQDPRPRLEQVTSYLGDQRVLLILDTCEHLIDACALFAETVLAGTEGVTILATSREPLFVAGEHEFPLRPLTLPGDGDGDGEGRVRDAGDGDAVDLFAQRAAAVLPGFRVTSATRSDVIRLCRHLDGIPLAIELASGQLRDLSFEELAGQLGGRFLDATGSREDGAGRHRTLRDAIGWSYKLCTPAERALWERLSVFAGPVSLDAAAQVCAGPGLDREAVTATLIGLVDKSVASRIGGDVSRYRMLDTIREYGAERLASTGTRDRVRAQHLRRYLHLAEEIAARPLEHQVPRHRALSAEHADIRATLEYAAALPDAEAAIRLPTSLAWYWVISARLHEGRYWLTRALERASEPGPQRAEALITRGYLAFYQGEFQSAITDTQEAIDFAAETGDRALRCRGLVPLVYALWIAGRHDESKQAAAEAGRLLGRGDVQLDAGVPAMLAIADSFIALLTGDFEGSLSHCEQALRQIPADSGERWTSGYLYGIAGLALSMLGRPDEGNTSVRRGLAMKHELGDKTGLAQGLGAAALVSAAQRRHERAAWLIGAADPLWKQIGPVFLGVDVMQALTDQAAEEARAVLGDSRYETVTRDAAALPLDQVVDGAVRDQDQLPALSAAGPE